MRRVCLHIGFQKTGSTAIQKFLSSHREYLLEEYSVLYPKSIMVLDCHVLLPHCILPMPRLKRLGVEMNIEKIKENLLNEIETHNPKIILLSSEAFSRFNSDQILKFRELFDLPITDIICYLRRQDLFVESVYKQRIKSPYIKNKKITFHEYISQYSWEINRLDYYTFLSLWKRTFPKAKIIPRIYDRKLFPDGDVILDFLSVLGINMPEARESKIEANPALSHLSTLVLQKIDNEFDLKVAEFNKILGYLLQLDREEGSQIKSFFTLKERIEFLNQFKESNEKLFREYFGTENQFVLSDEEIEFYKGQDKIPRDVIEKAVEERYRKVLEFMKANGLLTKERFFPKVNINYLPNANLEFFRINVVNANLLKDKLTIGGLALPKVDEENLKLTIRDAEGIKEVQWGLPSKALEEQYKDNPKAKNARFKIDNIVAGDKPIEIYVNDKKVAEIVIERASI